jgi:hypothetical protein
MAGWIDEWIHGWREIETDG